MKDLGYGLALIIAVIAIVSAVLWPGAWGIWLSRQIGRNARWRAATARGSHQERGAAVMTTDEPCMRSPEEELAELRADSRTFGAIIEGKDAEIADLRWQLAEAKEKIFAHEAWLKADSQYAENQRLKAELRVTHAAERRVLE